jgi:hypothetical protein
MDFLLRTIEYGNRTCGIVAGQAIVGTCCIIPLQTFSDAVRSLVGVCQYMRLSSTYVRIVYFCNLLNLWFVWELREHFGMYDWIIGQNAKGNSCAPILSIQVSE